MVLATFSELRISRHHVDAASYGRLLGIGLRVLSAAEDDGRRGAFLEEIIARCKDDGLVSKKFILSLDGGPSGSGDARRFGRDGGGWTAEESARVTRHYFGEWPLNKNWSRNVGHASTPSRGDLVYWQTEN